VVLTGVTALEQPPTLTIKEKHGKGPVQYPTLVDLNLLGLTNTPVVRIDKYYLCTHLRPPNGVSGSPVL
jgi:hypothetical protein